MEKSRRCLAGHLPQCSCWNEGPQISKWTGSCKKDPLKPIEAGDSFHSTEAEDLRELKAA